MKTKYSDTENHEYNEKSIHYFWIWLAFTKYSSSKVYPFFLKLIWLIFKTYKWSFETKRGITSINPKYDIIWNAIESVNAVCALKSFARLCKFEKALCYFIDIFNHCRSVTLSIMWPNILFKEFPLISFNLGLLWGFIYY